MIKLYSNGCPRCKILKRKLDEAGIEYEKTDDFKDIVENGFKTVPVLLYNRMFYDYAEAIKLINGGKI